MKLCFSTLACFDWTLADVYAAAKDLSFDGIEIRRLDNERYAPRMRCFSETRISSAVEMLSGGLSVPVLASAAVFGEREKAEESKTELREYCALAEKLKTPYIKVYHTSKVSDTSYDKDFAVNSAREFCDIAASFGVSLLVNMNGAFRDSGLLRDFLNAAARDNLFALWDTSYTCINGESPKTTVDNLKDRIKFVNLKDSALENGTAVNRLIGDGYVPIKEAVRLLSATGFDGWLSYEWRRSWGEEFSQAGMVLSHFSNYMERLLKEL